MDRYASSVSPKGQVTIPREIRELLGIKPKDAVTFRIDEGGVKIIPVRSALAASFMAVPALKNSLSIEQVTAIAAEEHAQEAAREGL